MTGTGGQSLEEERSNVLPPRLADILRPELPSLADEIITAIRDKIPEYARPIDGPYGQIMRTGVEQALTSFVDLVADPSHVAGRPRRGRAHARAARGRRGP